ERSSYTPVAALAGAIVLGVLLQGLGGAIGSTMRARLRFTPLRTLDSLGGLALGAATALAIVWVLGAVALHLPGQTELRREAQRSLVLRRLNEVVPPATVLRALERVDPFPRIAGPLATVDPPDGSVLRRPAIRRAARSVVRILGTSCGLGVAGSGWVASPRLVVTAAHVVAGQDSPTVQLPAGGNVSSKPVAYDARNDVAVLRLPPGAIRVPPLTLVDAEPGESVAIVGYPEDRGLTAAAGRVGQTTRFLTRDAYGRGPVFREVTTLRGRIRPGNSGGPAVDDLGRVQATIFASRKGSDAGFGVPGRLVRAALRDATSVVSTGPCAH
ncbi:MAG: trypsin-like peptidase domain-containing protein, partial [Thermoleophilia bacterium]|nr:trypsin-like peptidase domain-containing protein [Thermoleophilia bacterium]